MAFCILFLLLVAAACLNLFYGALRLEPAEVWAALNGTSGNDAVRLIVTEWRVPSTLTAALSGAALAVSGLLLQTAFANALADPGILGVNAGAGLGVAVVMLFMGGSLSVGSLSVAGFAAVLTAAFIGASLVLAALVFFASVLRNSLMLLIVGLMVSYVTSAVVSLLSALSTAEGVHSYIFWGMGSFGGVQTSALPWFASLIGAGLVASLGLMKPLNALLLGEQYAANLGVSVRRVRIFLLLVTGLLTSVTTAFCGPVSFLGLAVPHIARLISGTGNHRLLLPLTLLTGAVVALLSLWLCNLPGDGALIPLNVVTPLWGVPVILYVLFFRRMS